MYVKLNICMYVSRAQSNQLTCGDVRVRTKPQYVVVAHSSVSCARGVNACGACVVAAVVVLSCCYCKNWVQARLDELQFFCLSANDEVSPGF